MAKIAVEDKDATVRIAAASRIELIAAAESARRAALEAHQARVRADAAANQEVDDAACRSALGSDACGGLHTINDAAGRRIVCLVELAPIPAKKSSLSIC